MICSWNRRPEGAHDSINAPKICGKPATHGLYCRTHARQAARKFKAAMDRKRKAAASNPTAPIA